MPIIPHDACSEPSPDTVICRFLDLRKFRDLFANEELYFRRTDKFKGDDPNEGMPPDDYVRRSCGLTKYDLLDELALNNDQASNRQFSEMRYIQSPAGFRGGDAGHVGEVWLRRNFLSI